MASGRSELPAGLELVYDLEKEKVSSAFDAFVLSLHWSIIRTGLRQRTPNTTTDYTERLPTNWSERSPLDGEGTTTRTLTLIYYDPHKPAVKYELKVIELTSNDLVAVTFFRSGNTSSGGGASASAPGPSSAPASSPNRPASDKSSGVEKNSAASTFQIPNFIRIASFDEGGSIQRAADVYEHADLLEVQFYETIMEPLGLRVMGQPPVQGPYDDATKAERSSNEQPQRGRDPLAGDDPFYGPGLGRHPSPISPGFPMGPLHVPPVGGGGGLGRSDLDPLGRFGAGNILDPRGFRSPRGRGGIPSFPGGPPPGARFDPFGPPNPARPDGTGGNFFMPNPDHERPSSDYDDMFM